MNLKGKVEKRKMRGKQLNNLPGLKPFINVIYILKDCNLICQILLIYLSLQSNI